MVLLQVSTQTSLVICCHCQAYMPHRQVAAPHQLPVARSDQECPTPCLRWPKPPGCAVHCPHRLCCQYSSRPGPGDITAHCIACSGLCRCLSGHVKTMPKVQATRPRQLTMHQTLQCHQRQLNAAVGQPTPNDMHSAAGKMLCDLCSLPSTVQHTYAA